MTYKSDQFEEVVINVDSITCIRTEKFILDGEEQEIVVIMGDFSHVKVPPESASFDRICQLLNTGRFG